GYQPPHLRCGIAAVLNAMQSLQAQLQMFLVLFVPLRDARVEIPAVVVKGPAVRGLRDEGFHIALPFLLEIKKADDDVRDLNAGVIDIVLDVDVGATGAQEPDKRVAQHSVAQMTYMGSFVGIDAGVFDQNLFGGRRFSPDAATGQEGSRGSLTIQAGIYVAGAGHFKLLKTGNGSQRGHDLFGNFARRFAQLLGQLEAERQGVFAHRDRGWLVDHQPWQIEIVEPLQEVADVAGKLLL